MVGRIKIKSLTTVKMDGAFGAYRIRS